MIKYIISRLTMVKVSEEGFWDHIASQKIYRWQDYYFNTYLAHSKWGYRVKIEKI